MTKEEAHKIVDLESEIKKETKFVDELFTYTNWKERKVLEIKKPETHFFLKKYPESTNYIELTQDDIYAIIDFHINKSNKLKEQYRELTGEDFTEDS